MNNFVHDTERAFPYDAVYSHFAIPLVESGLSVETFSQRMYLVDTAEGAVLACQAVPVAHLFSSHNGKAHLGRVIREMVDVMPPSCCLVVISEVWVKAVPKEQIAEHDRKASLEGDPLADEAVGIFLYRPNVMRTGQLLIGADRQLTYAPLMPAGAVHRGRLALDPEPTAAVERAAADALYKAAAH